MIYQIPAFALLCRVFWGQVLCCHCVLLWFLITIFAPGMLVF
jgi:hypothetical protein